MEHIQSSIHSAQYTAQPLLRLTNPPYRIEEMHQQIAVFHRAEQCLEYAIYLGVYAVFHGGLL
jgi:hypothetical protein